MLKIAIVCSPWNRFQVPATLGSVPIWTYQVAARLAELAEVIVYSRAFPGDEPQVVAQGIQCVRVTPRTSGQLRARAGAAIWRMRGVPLDATTCFEPGYFRAVAEDAKLRGVDVVHIHSHPQFGCLFKEIDPRTKVVGHLHYEWINLVPRRIANQVLACTDVLIGCSDYVRSRHKTALAHGQDRFRTLPNGVDTDVFSSAMEPPNQKLLKILFVGRISPEKGIHTLIDAFGLVRSNFPEAKLQVIGPNWPLAFSTLVGLSTDIAVTSLRQYYKKTPLEHVLGGLASRYPRLFKWMPDNSYLSQLKSRADRIGGITFGGPVPHDQLARAYQSATIVVQPSAYEAFGIPLIEAMSCGVAVIGSDVGGIPEIVQHEKTGLLFPVGDSRALAVNIERLFRDESLRCQLADAGRQFVSSRYTWDIVALRALRIYKDLVGATVDD